MFGRKTSSTNSWHFSPVTQKPEPCSNPANCRYGAQHFGSPEEAIRYAESLAQQSAQVQLKATSQQRFWEEAIAHGDASKYNREQQAFGPPKVKYNLTSSQAQSNFRQSFNISSYPNATASFANKLNQLLSLIENKDNQQWLHENNFADATSQACYAPGTFTEADLDKHIAEFYKGTTGKSPTQSPSQQPRREFTPEEKREYAKKKAIEEGREWVDYAPRQSQQPHSQPVQQVQQQAPQFQGGGSVPSGDNVQIGGRITDIKTVHDAKWGDQLKYVIQDDRGFSVLGDPSKEMIGARVGDRIAFVSTVTPSKQNASFGFFRNVSGVQKLS